MELDLGCREDVDVRECFSSPEILELKAQCELARYRGTAPSRLQCPFGHAGPVFEVLSKPVSSVIILTLIRLSFAITARTTSTF